jgi:glycosyltransferase involved in cell wall biosynthesis
MSPRPAQLRHTRANEMYDSTLLKQAASQVSGLKIAIFVDDLSATGVVRNAAAIANRMRLEGWEVCLVAARAAGVLRSSIASGVAVRQLMEDPSAGLTRRSRLIRSFRSYLRFLKSFRPDVLLSAGNHGHLLTILASKAVPGCRTVFRISNDIDHRAQGKPGSRIARLVRRLQLRLVSDHADLMVVVSPHLKDDPVIASASSNGKVTIIPNGVDRGAVQEHARAECDHPWLADSADQPVILGVGRFVRQKNFGALIRAIAVARRAKPLRLLLIGSGPLQAELEREAECLGVRDCVAIVPPVANPMPFLMRAAAVVLPSWWEGSSNVLLEALACGTPVVASRTAGNAELVLDGGRYGVLVDPRDVDQMARAILRQCSEFAIRPGRRAQDFSVDDTLDAYSNALADLVAS